MTLVYFAWVKQKLGRGEEELTLPDDVVTLRGLAAYLRARGGAYETVFADLSALRAAIDHGHAQWDATIGDAGEIAFFPPVTGG